MTFLPPATSTGGRRRRQAAIGHNVRTETGLTPVSVLRSHVSACALAADDADQNAGLGWYDVAHELAIELGHGPAAGAGIISALSPQINWVDNIAAAQRLATGDWEAAQSIGALGDGISKGLRIMDGERPADVLGGRKVRSFFANILRPDQPGPVTIDRHAVAIALHGIGGRQPHEKWLERAGTYQLVASVYRAEARSFGILPHQLQAICWLAHRHRLDQTAPSHNLRSAHIRQRRN